MKIGFIGLGHMGSAIAVNLLAAGHELTVWNRSPGPTKALAEKGAHIAGNLEDALQGDVLFSMLANDDAIRQVGLNGPLLSRAKPRLVHVNLATVSIDLADELSNAHEAFAVGYVAAPVFGRPDVAAARNLSVVVAGPAADIAFVRPLLEAISNRVTIAGDHPRQANLFKLAGNLMLAAAIESMGEAYALVRKGGIDAQLFHDTLTTSSFACPVYRGYGDAIVSEKFEPAGFPVRLAMKDLWLGLEAARELYVPMPAASVAHGHFMEASTVGFADADSASLGRLLANKAGLPSNLPGALQQ
jgi:3-hydroxyisobutyrate dehydrogenase-like beta-hydroxyacid dehydrogenase